MPYHWTDGDRGSHLRLWPHRSLPLGGFAVVILVTAGMISLPLFSVLGTAVLWGLLPFLVAAVWGLWVALRRSYRDGELTEELDLDAHEITLIRRAPGGQAQEWRANPYWVEARLHAEGGPVEDYLTLRGKGVREVELGAFLTPEERQTLGRDLRARLADLRTPGAADSAP